MVAELLLEIGTEEIPSGYLDNAVDELKRLATEAIADSNIQMAGGIYAYGTPRRLVLIAKALADRQDDREEEITGPPKKVAFDGDGNPTKAALGFAKRQGVSVEDLQIKTTPKGEYLMVKKVIEGRPTIEILSELLPDIIARIPWPKSMRWGSVGFLFARPIHWVLALLNSDVIPFEVAGVKSGNKTRGHRFMAPEEVEIFNLQDYLQRMEQAYVIIDANERKRLVEAGAKSEAEKIGGNPGLDPDLVTTVANLVEYPVPFCGGFDEKFLSLPDAVLITAMKEHQKYFAVHRPDGKLMPNFVAISNTRARDMEVVRKGNERVLRARLADADFFFKEDRKRPLLDRLQELKDVIYQADLGTSYQKVMRFTELANFLSKIMAPDKQEHVSLACRLSKCDLVTHMVGEFPSLQGIMGEIYARLDGHQEEVCVAIREHYLPLRAGGQLPQTNTGAIVGLADRMDTICGCFAVGLEPSGTADPFALRRHALAILRILEHFNASVSLPEFIQRSLEILKQDISFDHDAVYSKVFQFFRERYKYMMLRTGYASDEVEAVISVVFDRVDQLRPMIDQLRRFSRESSDFEALALTFKRVTNILKKQKDQYGVDPSLFREPCESSLWEAYEELREDVEALVDKGDYYGALALMARLRKPVDEFFDGVEILTKDSDQLRQNRIGLLQHISRLFLQVADFSKFGV